ncbi:MAG: hypothetical protein NXH82_00795 [Rhodobacteraceae bacterium]|nr:hypothetical protein [Paracoccaceae bacterium]
MSALDILARLIGPQRAVSVYIHGRRWGIPALLLTVFAGGWALFIGLSDPDRYRHLAYLTVPVVGTAPLTGTGSSGIFVDVALPDGTVLNLNTTEGPMIQSISDTACLQQREDTKTNAVTYRLRLPGSCARAQQ